VRTVMNLQFCQREEVIDRPSDNTNFSEKSLHDGVNYLDG
jgi:hypothetical protein